MKYAACLAVTCLIHTAQAQDPVENWNMVKNNFYMFNASSEIRNDPYNLIIRGNDYQYFWCIFPNPPKHELFQCNDGYCVSTFHFAAVSRQYCIDETLEVLKKADEATGQDHFPTVRSSPKDSIKPDFPLIKSEEDHAYWCLHFKTFEDHWDCARNDGKCYSTWGDVLDLNKCAGAKSVTPHNTRELQKRQELTYGGSKTDKKPKRNAADFTEGLGQRSISLQYPLIKSDVDHAYWCLHFKMFEDHWDCTIMDGYCYSSWGDVLDLHRCTGAKTKSSQKVKSMQKRKLFNYDQTFDKEAVFDNVAEDIHVEEDKEQIKGYNNPRYPGSFCFSKNETIIEMRNKYFSWTQCVEYQPNNNMCSGIMGYFFQPGCLYIPRDEYLSIPFATYAPPGGN